MLEEVEHKDHERARQAAGGEGECVGHCVGLLPARDTVGDGTLGAYGLLRRNVALALYFVASGVECSAQCVDFRTVGFSGHWFLLALRNAAIPYRTPLPCGVKFGAQVEGGGGTVVKKTVPEDNATIPHTCGQAGTVT